MALNINNLADELVEIFKQEVTVTTFDAITGASKKTTEMKYPDKDKMKLLSEALIKHINNNSEIIGVESNVTVSTINGTVAPGIAVTTPAGPGVTSSTGIASGTGRGNSKQSNAVRVK